MRVPKRKPGKYTDQKLDRHLTASKLNEFKVELKKIKDSIRPNLMKEVSRLAELGDFSENMEYQIAKGKLRGTNQRIEELEDAIKKAIIITPTTSSNIVLVGCHVTVEIYGQQKKYQILGSTEVDLEKGVISRTSPIGSALIGKRVGDTININLAKKEVSCKILKIE